MSYRLLKAFHAVCITGSISKAAVHLCLTQPAVSIALKKLEKQYALALVKRHGPKIELTEDGSALQLLVSDMFDAENSVTNFLKSREALETGLLKVASDGPVLPLKLLECFRENHPAVVLDIRFGNHIECWQALIQREVDIALIAKSGIPVNARDHVIERFVRNIGISVILPLHHPLAQHQSLSITQLLNEAMLFRESSSNTQKNLMQLLDSLNVIIAPRATLSSREAIINGVGRGLGIGFCLDDEAVGYKGAISVPLIELRKVSEDVVVALPASLSRKIVKKSFDFIEQLNK